MGTAIGAWPLQVNLAGPPRSSLHREVASNTYSTLPYLLAQIAAELPYITTQVGAGGSLVTQCYVGHVDQC